MADSPCSTESHQSRTQDMLQIHKDLERIIEDVEDISVQLTWMAYDMVAQRTIPELQDSRRRLEEAYLRCNAAVLGDRDREESNKEKCPDTDPAAKSHADL